MSHRTIITSPIAAKLFVLAIPLLVVTPVRAAFTPGNILIDYFVATPTDFSANIHQYSPTGTLINTFSTPKTIEYRGVALTPDGNLITTYDTIGITSPDTSGFLIFSSDGSLIANENTPQIGASDPVPGAPSVFADGTVAIPDQLDSSVLLYSQDGTYLRSISLPTLTDPWISARAPDNTIWIANYSSGPMVHINESGAVLGSFSVPFQTGSFTVDPSDGSLWFTAADGKVHHLSATGTELSSFSVPVVTIPPPAPNYVHGNSIPSGIAFANDGTLYIDGSFDPNLYHYTTSGMLLGSFPIDPPGYAWSIAVVPNPSILGDANLDGSVNLSNLATVLNNFGQPTTAWTSGNFDGSPTIDLSDLADVLNNFGQSNPNPTTPTPEPTSLALLASSAALFLTRRRR